MDLKTLDAKIAMVKKCLEDLKKLDDDQFEEYFETIQNNGGNEYGEYFEAFEIEEITSNQIESQMKNVLILLLTMRWAFSA